MRQQIEVITGPTASGKSALALQRARADASVEIVNADSSLLYRGFDIGTAKPSLADRESAPHHLLDILEPAEHFSAADYVTRARSILRDIVARDKKPIIVGGTGFYIDALFEGLPATGIAEADLSAARDKYFGELEIRGFDALLLELEPIDPVLFEQVTRERNPRRLQRAWEFYYATGTPLGVARQQKSDPFEFEPSYTLLLPVRAELVRRIEQRVDEMLAAGWLDEVRGLLHAGVVESVPAYRAIGYRTLAEVLREEKSLEEAREEIIVLTRQYAKRQVTWMKRYAGK